MSRKPNIRDVFADNLRRLRSERGISQEELARSAEISRAYISTLEHGRKAPTIETLEALANVLDVEAAALIARRS
jgi:transcriptional regulator with XRE-family HTH domain